MRSNHDLWSFSRVNCFDNCKYEFYLQYILNDEEQYLPEDNYYAEVGSFVHKILALVFEKKLKPEETLEYFINNYENNVFYKIKQSTMDKTFEAIADYFAEFDIDYIKDYEILGVELETKFKIDNYDFIGYIDLLLRDKKDGKIIVVDHKSSEYPFNKIKGGVKKHLQGKFESYKKQMYLYCHAINMIYGEFPKEIIWNHFKDGGKLVRIPFVKSEYEETLEWFRHIVKSIKDEEEYEPSEEYFYCHNICNFRSSCEYKKYGTEE